MIVDTETDIFLKNRIKNNSKLHHLLDPVELRTERLRQLREDNLTPPKVNNVENLKIKNRFNKDVKLRFYFPNNFNKKTKIPIIVFFHGGGFVMGDLDTHDFTCRSICLASQMIVVAVDYSLSPEHKFPYAVEEVKDVLNNLVNFEKDFFIDLENIFVCGDSAGGNLATILAINSRDKKVIPIRGQLLVYPCVDLTLTMRSMDIFLEGMTLTFDTMDYFVKHYLNSSNDAVNWEASPLFAKNLHNLPETFIFAAGLDPLLDEGIAYANRLKSFGNKVTYKLYPGQIHGFLSNSIHFPKAAECIQEIAKAANSMVLKKRG